jgi:hypothetical protein
LYFCSSSGILKEDNVPGTAFKSSSENGLRHTLNIRIWPVGLMT